MCRGPRHKLKKLVLWIQTSCVELEECWSLLRRTPNPCYPNSHREAKKDALLREILVTHVFAEHQRLAWFVKAFDKRRRGRAVGAGIPGPLSRSTNYQSGSLGRKERIPFVDLLSVCCGSFPCGYQTIQDTHILTHTHFWLQCISHTYMPKAH